MLEPPAATGKRAAGAKGEARRAKKRRKAQGNTEAGETPQEGSAVAPVEEGPRLEDVELGSEDADDVELESWLRPCPKMAADYGEATEGWWWSEAIWSATVALITSQEARSQEDAMPQETDGRAKVPKANQAQKLKRRNRFQAEDLLAASPLWCSGPKAWRRALETVWSGTDIWTPAQVAATTMHERGWRLATKLLQQRFWQRSGRLLPWQAQLGKHHSEWFLAKLLQHLRLRYGIGWAAGGTRQTRSSMVHALQAVAQMPSIEECAPPLVKLCLHGCVHWLLLEPDTQLQQLAITVIARCRSYAFMSQCEDSLKRLCDDGSFSTELLSLSATKAASAEDPEKPTNVLYQHRDKVFPLVLRILFSKATKKGSQLDKRTTQATRRGAIFAYLAPYLEDKAMPELFIVLLGSLMKVLILPSDEMPSSPSDVAAVTSSFGRRRS